MSEVLAPDAPASPAPVNPMAARRRRNLLAWMASNKITRTELALRLKVGRAYVSLLFDPGRHFGERAARAMELKLHLPEGYLDSDGAAPTAVAHWSAPEDLPDGMYALVARVEVRIESGALVDVEQELPPLAFRRDFLQRKLVTSRDSLRFCEVGGDSMQPYLFGGDLVLVDMAQTEVKDGEIFAISHSSEIRIKRLMKRFDGGLYIRSDHPGYPEESLSPEQAESILIIGRVLWRAG